MKCPKCHFKNPAEAIDCSPCGIKFDTADQISFTKTLETTSDELARGTIFTGRYEIIEELGTSGMGKVYRAFDKKIEEEVALKLLKPEIAADKKTIGRFKNELKLARQITHKNVCRMHDLHEEGRTLYITMEYVRGEDLKSVIRRMEKLTVGKAVLIARQIGKGLAKDSNVATSTPRASICWGRSPNSKVIRRALGRITRNSSTSGRTPTLAFLKLKTPERGYKHFKIAFPCSLKRKILIELSHEADKNGAFEEKGDIGFKNG
jgi:serine/threonine protein kinase